MSVCPSAPAHQQVPPTCSCLWAGHGNPPTNNNCWHGLFCCNRGSRWVRKATWEFTRKVLPACLGNLMSGTESPCLGMACLPGKFKVAKKHSLPRHNSPCLCRLPSQQGVWPWPPPPGRQAGVPPNTNNSPQPCLLTQPVPPGASNGRWQACIPTM